MENEAITPDTELALVKGHFEEWFQATTSPRAVSERCRDYKDGYQWTPEERDVLTKRKQPVLTDNKIADKCDTLLGIERQMRTDPKAFPRTPGHEEDAEAATDALRYVADDNTFQRSVRSPSADNLIVEGLAYIEITIEKHEGKQHPKICTNHVPWNRGYYDIHSQKLDFSDKRWCGFFTWMDYDAAIEEWPGKKAILDQSVNESNETEESTKDRPAYVQTVGKRKRIRFNTHFYLKKKVWHRSVWCSGGWLEEPKPSEYKDENEQPECCLEIQAVYRDREGHPYGPTKNWLDRQDAINKRQSKLLHLLNTKQIVAPKGVFPDNPITGESGVKMARDQLH